MILKKDYFSCANVRMRPRVKLIYTCSVKHRYKALKLVIGLTGYDSFYIL